MENKLKEVVKMFNIPENEEFLVHTEWDYNTKDRKGVACIYMMELN